WNYDPDDRGWYVYGLGHISTDGKQAVPDKGVAIYEFTGAMFNGGNAPPPAGPPPCGKGACCMPGGSGPGNGESKGGGNGGKQKSDAGRRRCGAAADPVSIVNGQFEHTERDFLLPDVMPIDLTRTYRAFDKNIRAFGVGMTHAYDIF